MALNHKYTILCDDVRREDNGKLILLGMYFGTITVLSLPTTLPSFTVLSVFEADRVGNLPFTLKIQRLENGKTIVEAQGFVNVAQPGPTVVPVKFSPIVFDEAGSYSAVVDFQNGSTPIVENFNLIITPQMGVQLPFRPGR